MSGYSLLKSENNVQGTDYAYTLQGWLKGINGESLTAQNDMGRDGDLLASVNNSYFGEDVASFVLDYYDGDYSPIQTAHLPFSTLGTTSSLSANRNDLWNGNIGAMRTHLDPSYLSGPDDKTVKFGISKKGEKNTL